MKHKFLFAMLAIFMIFSITACDAGTGSSETPQNTGKIETTVQQTTEPTTEITTEPNAVVPGNYVEHDNLKFSFESAKQYDEIKGDNEYISSKPADGKKYLVLFFEVENISNEEQNVNLFYSKAYVDDYDIDQAMLLAEPDGYSALSGDLKPGKKLKGYLAYEVDPDWKKLEVTYTDGIFSDGPEYNFEVTPDKLS